MHDALDSIDLAPYSGLHGAGAVHHASMGPCFICEGRRLVEDAIEAAKLGHLQLVSILCDSRRRGEWEAKMPRQARLISLDAAELDGLVGFRFHRGVLCCCAVPDPPSEAHVIQSPRLLVLPHVDNVDNLGQLSRTAAALGIGAMLLGKGPDPFSRRCVRVSMGAVWKIPILKVGNPDQILDGWLQISPGIKSEIVGTAMAPDAEAAWRWRPAPRTALVLGPESHGLDDFWRHKCGRHVRIPMVSQIDSLNISAAGAILMGKMAV